MDGKVISREIDTELYRKILCGIRTCLFEPFDKDLMVDDQIQFREVRNGLLTGRFFNVSVTEIFFCDFCPPGMVLVSFQQLSRIAKISVEAYMEMLDMYCEKCHDYDVLEKNYRQLLNC